MKKDKLSELKKARDNILPEAKFWNRQRLFLMWAFSAAIMLTAAIGLVEIITGEYYYIALIILFVFGLFSTLKIGGMLDEVGNTVNKTYDVLDKEISRIKKK